MQTGYKTFKEIVDDVANFHQDGSSEFKTNVIKPGLNRHYITGARLKDWPQLRKLVTQGLNFVAGKATLYLPPDLLEPFAMIDLTNKIWQEGSRMENILWDMLNYFDTSGLAERFANTLDFGKYQDFHTSAEKLTVESTSASDTTPKVRLWMMDNSTRPREITELLTLTGTTPVATTATLTDLLSAALDSSHVGTILVKGQTSALTYAEILPHERTVRYKGLIISQPSVSANSIALLYKRAPRSLINDEDTPELPIAEYLFEAGVAVGFEYAKKQSMATHHLNKALATLDANYDEAIGGAEFRVQSRPQPRPKMSYDRYIYKQGSVI